MVQRIAVTGRSGKLGSALHALSDDRTEISGVTSSQVDVRDWAAVRDWLAVERPNAVVHAAAMTNVDGCETAVDDAFAINGLGTRHVAAAADRIGATFVYISTNFVFDGTKTDPYHEFDQPNPISVYGQSKLAGESEAIQTARSVYVLRTAMVYDETGNNFVNTMLRLMAERPVLTVVDDQTGNPTYAPDLAAGILQLISTCPPGMYHLTNSGSTSWFGWANELQQLTGLDCEIQPIPAASYQRAATPPANGVLTSLALSERTVVMPHWTDALARCLRRS